MATALGQAGRSSWKRQVLLGLALSALIVGCGSSSTPSKPPAAIAYSPQALATVAAAAVTTARDTATVQVSVSDAGAFGTTTSSAHGHGLFDFIHGKGSEVLTTMTPHRRSAARAQSWTLVFLPKTVYSRPPRESKWELPRTKPWMSIDLMRTDTLSTNSPEFVPQIESLNPLIPLEELRWGGVAARAMGATAVDGARAHHYDVTVDLRRALSKANGRDKVAFVEGIGPPVGWIGGSVASGKKVMLDVQVWVNERGRVVRIQADSLVGMGTTTMVFRGFAEPAIVRPPVRSRSIDIASVGPSGERENKGGGDSDGA